MYIIGDSGKDDECFMHTWFFGIMVDVYENDGVEDYGGEGDVVRMMVPTMMAMKKVEMMVMMVMCAVYMLSSIPGAVR